jgi:sigma-B regulation protein RsbU (phosphoserine phosphatase)
LQALHDEAPCGLLVTDRAGMILRANATFCRWLEVDAASLVGQRRFQDLLTTGGRIFHQTHWAPLLQMQGSISEVKLDIRHADGRALPMVMNAVRRERDGDVLHELAVFAAGDRHAYEQELMRARRQAESLLAEQQHRALYPDQLVAIVTHDLRNPLSPISLGVGLLGRLDPTAQQATVVDSVGRSVRRARRLIDDLLDFTMARIGRGLPVAIAPVDLHAVVANHVHELALAEPGRTLNHVRRGDGTVPADADRVFQLLSNLVANAAAYGAPDAPITITSAVEGGVAVLAVHNLGEPIPPSLLPTLFQPMVRGDDTPSGTRSVGLGLYIVSEIARAHGGAVRVASSTDAGTRFEATLGRPAPAAERPDAG